MAEKKKNVMTFESAMQRLDEITDKLSDGSATLDESLELYSQGVKMIAFCREKLDDAERKISMVTDKTNGSVSDFTE